ncbi:hypothetical protein M1D70_09485 [Paenibacillus sp. AK002]
MARTDWDPEDEVKPADMNEIGREINELELRATVWLGTTEGSGTEYTVDSDKVSSLFDGLRVSFRAHVASGANPTLQINVLGAVPLKKPNGRAVKLDADGVYTAVYSAASFILQGEGGEYGTATAADVLAPKTFGTDEGIVTGTIPTQGNQFKSGLWSNPDGDAFVDTYVNIDGGYYPPGTQMTIQAYDPNLDSKNIRAGAEVFGVDGDSNVVDTSDATLGEVPGQKADYMLINKTAYVKGKKLTGSMPDNRNRVFDAGVRVENFLGEPSFKAYIPAGGFVDPRTSLFISVPTMIPSNIRSGVKILGVTGTMPGGSISRISKGQVTMTGSNSYTSPIPDVDVNKAVLFFTVTGLTDKPRRNKVRGFINGPSWVNFSVNYPPTSTTPVTVQYQVVEYENVKQIIRGSANREVGAGATVVNLPTPVTDMTKCFLVGSYETDAAEDWNWGVADPRIWFLTESTIAIQGSIANKPGVTTSELWHYQVVEYN